LPARLNDFSHSVGEFGIWDLVLSKKGSMKNQYIICFGILFVILLASCREDGSHSPLKFKGYEGNPVLSPGKPGEWDDLMLLSSFCLKHDSLIYLFYSAYSQIGKRSIGLATSSDGYHFTKFAGNPILEGDQTGFDAFGVAQAQVIRSDSGWVLYYNAREIAGFSSGPFFGRATAQALTGPWTTYDEPVLTSGRRGEWDSDFIYLGPVLVLEDGSYVLYYGGGSDLTSQEKFFIGMATSKDGISWKKYNDPSTKDHPFAESDPVMTGTPGTWDASVVLADAVIKLPGGFGMYYAGTRNQATSSSPEESQIGSIGFATSKDGIHWKKYRNNPVYQLADDPYSKILGNSGTIIQNAKLLIQDTLCFMYYDYGNPTGPISMATARVPSIKPGVH
jgi:predicted GH43/DUF377 family glycosyl hydrolase